MELMVPRRDGTSEPDFAAGDFGAPLSYRTKDSLALQGVLSGDNKAVIDYLFYLKYLLKD